MSRDIPFVASLEGTTLVVRRLWPSDEKSIGGKITKLPRDWPPPLWQGEFLPLNDTVEAVIEWIDYSIRIAAALGREQSKYRKEYGDDLWRNAVMKTDGEQFVRDAHRIVAHLVAKGWCDPPAEPHGRQDVPTALRTLQRVKGWILRHNPKRPLSSRSKDTEDKDNDDLIVAALNKHHRYDHDEPLHIVPIVVSEVARQLDIGKASVSRFFKREFGSHKDYKRSCVDEQKLRADLKALNREYTPKSLRKTGKQ